MAQRLLGKEVNEAMNQRIRDKIAILAEKGVTPAICTIRVGEDPGDISYEKSALKRCQSLGIEGKSIVLPVNVTQEELLSVIDQVNQDKLIHGVLLFRPLPRHLDAKVIENALSPEKDVDGMTDLSMAGVFTGREIGYPPCTPQACMEILDHYGIDCTGKKAVVVGRSLVVGKPAAMMLLKRNATVTVCHTRTRNMPEITKEADILIAAVGHAGAVAKEHLGEGQIIIDVGINVNEEGKLCGDVKFEDAEPVCAMITPVPGGVGSVTTTVLMEHVVNAAMKTL